MSTPSWSRGYYTSSLYTCGFYREMAPNWLDFAALIKGHSPRRREGAPFRYLELGSGMGLHLCLLAGAYPEGTFVGIDFHVDQIAHSRQLAHQTGLTNVSFVQADLVDLAAETTKVPATLQPEGSFDYVVSHGLYSWVNQDVQAALLSLTARSLAIGGLFYCSYNCLPGWYPGAIFQQLAEQERGRSDPRDPLVAYRRAAAQLIALADPEAEEPTPLARSFPSLAKTVAEAIGGDPRYVVHEYANANWQPLYVHQMHAQVAIHQLRPLGSASLPEQFPGLLPSRIQEAVQPDSAFPPNELLVDIATNKRFRRDLFVRGFRPLSDQELDERIGAVWLVSTAHQPIEAARYITGFGEVTTDTGAVRRVQARLAEGSASVRSLAEELAVSLHDTVILVSLMLHGDQVGLLRPDGPAEACKAVNGAFLRLMLEGAPYQYVIAPGIGTAMAVTPVEAILLEATGQGLDAEGQIAWLVKGMLRLGRQLRSVEGDAGDQQALARTAVESFQAQGLKKFSLRGIEASTTQPL